MKTPPETDTNHGLIPLRREGKLRCANLRLGIESPEHFLQRSRRSRFHIDLLVQEIRRYLFRHSD
jgi:hypothetical protein